MSFKRVKRNTDEIIQAGLQFLMRSQNKNNSEETLDSKCLTKKEPKLVRRKTDLTVKELQSQVLVEAVRMKDENFEDKEPRGSPTRRNAVWEEEDTERSGLVLMIKQYRVISHLQVYSLV